MLPWAGQGASDAEQRWTNEAVSPEMKHLKAFAALALYLVVYAATYWTHVTFLRVDVVFYSALFDALLAALVVGLALLKLEAFAEFTSLEKLQTFLIMLLLGYVAAISIPTVIDRSLSFYILEKLQQKGGRIPESAFESIFTNDYLREHRLVDVRLTEQQASGTVVIEDGCVLLTPRGERLASFSRFFRTRLLPKQRLLRGTYSDVLTDPFRGQPTGAAHSADDACQGKTVR